MSASDIFMYVELPFGSSAGEGQTTDLIGAGEKGVEIITFSHEVEQTQSGKGGSGQSCDDVTHGYFTITKFVDALSPKLFKWCSSGQYIRKVRIAVYGFNNGNTVATWKQRTPYLEYIMTYVLVAKYNPFGGGGDMPPRETMCFNYGQMEVKFTGSAVGASGDGSEKWSLLLELPAWFVS